MEALRKLQGGEGSRNKWQSLTLALKTVWKSSEIADLEQSLHHVQATLTLQICALTKHATPIFFECLPQKLIGPFSYWHGVFQRQLDEMRSKTQSLNSQQSAKLDDIARLINDLGTRIEIADPKPLASSFNPPEIESLQRQMSQLSMAKADVAKEHAILESLSFESLPIRYSSIPEAHQRTFRWVFE